MQVPSIPSPARKAARFHGNGKFLRERGGMSKIVLGPSSISQARSPSYTAHLKTDRQADRDRQTHTCLGPLPRGMCELNVDLGSHSLESIQLTFIKANSCCLLFVRNFLFTINLNEMLRNGCCLFGDQVKR